MLKQILTFFISFITISGFSQDYSTLWEQHFSYYEIKDVDQGDNKIFAASENAIFTYDLLTAEIDNITTVNGLSGDNITTIHYSDVYDILLIGYENGLIEAVFNDKSVLSVVDILEKETLSPDVKKINHFNEYEGLVYISTDYGISVYDLERLEFGDTYFMGNGGSQIIVNQTTIFDGNIYAACSSGNAIKKANLTNPNLVDYLQWQTISVGNFITIQSVNDKLYTVRLNRVAYEMIDDALIQLNTYADLPLDTKVVDEYLIITSRYDVFIYDSDYNLLLNITTNDEYDTLFSSATLVNNNIYIGTSSFGVLKTTFENPTEFDVIRPEGPLNNNAFRIQAGNGDLWVTFGDYTLSYNPAPVRRYGISHLVDDSWRNIPFDSLLGARNLNYIAINPFNTNQVFISSYQDGILEINNGEVSTLLDNTNSGLESLVVPNNPNAYSIRQSGSVFDRSGVMWTMTSRVDRPLKSFNPSSGQWQSFSFEEIIPDGLNDEAGFSDVVVDGNGTKWTGGFFNGLIGFNENGNLIRQVDGLENNMPSEIVRALAIDSRNQLWIGTFKGLRVLYNTSGFFEDPDPSVSEIVILEDGIPQELLSNQFISDIKVDGSDNKWVGTLTSGVFYFSPDGQETIYHFTKDNSPLPSNTINDISIDDKDGRVYIATEKGMVSFLSGGSKPEDELKNAFVYPNPVRPEYDLLGYNDLNNITKGVKIKGLTENVNVKITDIEGNLVAEAQSNVNQRSSNYNFAIDGGTGVWNGKNLANNVVATGVYLIMISDLDSFETKVLKLLIVR
ncbi:MULTISPECIES: two-component regulator propeller domain-containing protein [Gaetbulibacter]|jgi:ligand-binding sensor domain-containing protein|uniref:type IX secretion system anionic LPS delivery protein PorZ n=1 Tax=Gaetbulibacter TaxID=311207 RepID=UPI0021D31E30|nr:two-component regulator propeller domain-containing protein [Gaetbulibacter sp. NE]